MKLLTPLVEGITAILVLFCSFFIFIFYIVFFYFWCMVTSLLFMMDVGGDL